MFRYTRNLVDEGNGKFNVMALCWGEGHGSSVHDHSGSDCFVKVLDGQLQETLFDWPCDSDDDSKPLEEKGKVVLGKNEVTYMCGEIQIPFPFFSPTIHSFCVVFALLPVFYMSV